MADTGMTPNMQSWTDDLRSVGRVEIGTSFKSLIWRVGIAAIVVAVVVWLRYQAGDIGDRGLTIAIVGFVALIFGCVVFVKMKWGASKIVVERDSVILYDGKRIPWSGITDISVFNNPRSGSALQVNLTEEAWADRMGAEGRGGKMMHGANKFITRNRGLVQPEYMDVNPAEFAAWLNQFPTGVAEMPAETETAGVS